MRKTVSRAHEDGVRETLSPSMVILVLKSETRKRFQFPKSSFSRVQKFQEFRGLKEMERKVTSIRKNDGFESVRLLIRSRVSSSK